MAGELTCGICNGAGSDVSLLGCDCLLHVRCLPVSIVAQFDQLNGFEATKSQCNLCPCCQSSVIEKIKLLPLWLDDLDKAVELQKKRGRRGSCDIKDTHFQDIESEVSYVHLSRGGGPLTASLNQHSYQRTGRWTNEEIAYTDSLVDAFDKGILPIEQGVRLNDFLGDMLMCKGSRLTKKMKNAKLSSRSYELSSALGKESFRGVDTRHLSTLEDRFLGSISCEASRLELRFHVTKAWRSHFSNFCLQLGSLLLEADEWVTSLEIMEQRAAKAEETIRNARRLRMGIALKADISSAQQGVFFNGMAAPLREKPVSAISHSEPPRASLVQSAEISPFPRDSSSSITSSDEGDADFISNILDFPSNKQPTGEVDELASFFDDLADQPWNETQDGTNANSLGAGSFVEEMVSFVEQEDLPFEHVDLWVPSFTEGLDGKEEMRLFHAGQGTRSDLDASLFFRMCEYGEYSTKFSFAVGSGLPGRVYFTDKPSWERHLHEQDATVFKRAGGAKIYGVKTALGVTVVSKAIGRIVVVFYSVNDLPDDLHIVERVVAGLARYSPNPKWKLVVEMEESQAGPSSSRLVHYEHYSNKTQKVVPHSVSMASMDVNHQENLVPASVCQEETQEEEQLIATLLGQHMPISQAAPCNNASDLPMLSSFMSLRLLLFRSPCRRSAQEAERVDTIVKSYRGYAQGDRTEKNIVDLLVQEWRYLSQHHEDAPKTNDMDHAYQSHMMNRASMSTLSSGGIPTRQPQALSFVPPPNRDYDGSAFDQDFKKRRVSSNDGSIF